MPFFPQENVWSIQDVFELVSKHLTLSHSKIKTIRYFTIASVFLHEVATVLTGIINQRKSKPDKWETQQKEIENWQVRGGGLGERREKSLFLL